MTDLVSQVKQLQQDPNIKAKWQTYCEIFGNNQRDPAKHPETFLLAFLQSVECLQQSQSEVCQIFVGGVPDVPEKKIRDYFSQWGEVVKVEIKVGKGFAFVTFAEREPVDAVLANHEAHEIDGKWIDCKPAENRRHSAMTPAHQTASGAQKNGRGSIPARKSSVVSGVAAARVRAHTFSPIQRVQARVRPAPYAVKPIQAPRPKHLVQPNAHSQQDRQKVASGPLVHNEIFVGGLSPTCTEQDVVDYFGQWGEITSVEFKHGKGFAFVTFQSASPVKKIMAQHTSHVIDGKWVDCKVAENRRVTPVNTTPVQVSAPQSLRPPVNPTRGFAPSRVNAPSRHAHGKIEHGESVSNQIFCGGLPPDTTEDAMLDTFSQFGAVEKIELKETKGFGFVTFESTDAVQIILANKDDITINGKWVDCKEAEDRRPPGKGQ